jgi:hypothetical protein
MRLFALACLSLLPGAASAPVRVAFPPEIVGPPGQLFRPCPLQIATPEGTGPGAAIPVARLRLGRAVERNATPFPTGGSATANATERHRRQLAGLQYDPKTFNPARKALPSVFAVEQAQLPAPWVYQQLPLKSDDRVRGDGMIFAQATSATRGRIASLALNLPAKPGAAPRITVTGGEQSRDGCRLDNPVDIYAPATPTAQLRRLFAPSGCNWRNLPTCKRSEWPRGQVLFVQRRKNGAGYEYRWVDYDLLAKPPAWRS